MKSARCKKQRCSKPVRAHDLCASHAQMEADALFSKQIRHWYGSCVADDKSSSFWQGPYFACSGRLSCAHLISRGYHSTRWEFDNAVALCASHHRWLDTHPLQKDDMCEAWLGEERWNELRVQAKALTKPDYDVIISHLVKEVADGTT